MNEADLLRLQELLSSPKSIVLVPHKNPDGDAMGSCLAWFHYLQGQGHPCVVISPNEFPRFLKWMPGSRQVLIAEREPRKARERIAQAELVFTLDFNGLGRAAQVGELLSAAREGKTFVMIDHHQEPEDYADITCSDTSVSSTCELSYRILRGLMGNEEMNPDMASCLYTGMVTDTGSFKYRSTGTSTHLAAAYLIGRGIDNTAIHQQLFDTFTPGRLQLLGKTLANMQIRTDLRTAYTSLSQDELDASGYEKGDTEGFVNYGLSLEGITFAAIFIENREEGIIKISFRSSGSFDVNQFARRHFEGGGHINASGGRSLQSLEQTLYTFESLLTNYAEQLQTP